MAERVLGVLAGNDLPLSLLDRWARAADHHYAADRGALPLLELGFRPTVVGDMDSIDPATDLAGLRVVRDDDQESSDVDKMLALVRADGHSSLVLTGMEGDDPAHELATLGSVARSGLPVTLAYRRGAGVVVGPGSHEFRGRGKVSVLPLQTCPHFTIEGVRWPLHDVTLALDGQISLSNHAEGPFKVAFESGLAFVFLEQSDGWDPWNF